MKLSSFLLLSVAFAAADAAAPERYQIHRIDYSDLVNAGASSSDPSASSPSSEARSALLDALTSVGLVSVTNVPGYAASRSASLAWGALHECASASSSEEGEGAAAAATQTFPDGTVRRTVAGHTIPGPGGAQPLVGLSGGGAGAGTNAAATSSPACDAFRGASHGLRSSVSEATRAFSVAVSSALGATGTMTGPLLATREGHPFLNFADVVENGEHLEHFHSYQRHNAATAAPGPARVGAGSQANELDEADTIDMHTDQGLFIAFTPGRMVGKDTENNDLTGGFYVGLPDGSRAEVAFDETDLVFMLGDGVNRYVNPKIGAAADGKNNAGGRKLALRATPHALVMPSHSSPDEARTWYGRMVLPPYDAVIPEQHDMTHGELRRKMIEETVSGEGEGEGATAEGQQAHRALDVGCSSHHTARILSGGDEDDDEICPEGTLFCWHRCMNHTEYHPVSPEICANRKLDLKCVNPRGQLYVEGHGDFFPDCIDAASASDVTPFPTLPGYPTDTDATCTAAKWEEYAKTGDDDDDTKQYEHCYAIGEHGKAKLCWSVVDETFIDARLAFNGLFGYLAMGFADEGDGMSAMYGASIIMGLPGDDFNPVDGLNLTLPANVREYVISPDFSRFRHWSQPVSSSATASYGTSSTECFTSLTFKTDSINARKFNATGSDRLIWAANGKGNYVEFHGQDQRNIFHVEWATGKAWEEGTKEDEGEVEPEDGDTSAGVTRPWSAALAGPAAIAGAAFVGLFV